MKAEQKKGCLTLFVGMGSGVGKTYAMLKSAREEIKKGRRVATCFIDTRGRRDTKLLFEELAPEIDLKSPCDLVLIDDVLWDENRFEQLFYFLEEGVDVFATLTLHPERPSLSLALSRANFIKIIDITPEELLKRLVNGQANIDEAFEICLHYMLKQNCVNTLKDLLFRLLILREQFLEEVKKIDPKKIL